MPETVNLGTTSRNAGSGSGSGVGPHSRALRHRPGPGGADRPTRVPDREARRGLRVGAPGRRAHHRPLSRSAGAVATLLDRRGSDQRELYQRPSNRPPSHGQRLQCPLTDALRGRAKGHVRVWRTSRNRPLPEPRPHPARRCRLGGRRSTPLRWVAILADRPDSSDSR